jgi:hypothetical protein
LKRTQCARAVHYCLRQTMVHQSFFRMSSRINSNTGHTPILTS